MEMIGRMVVGFEYASKLGRPPAIREGERIHIVE